MKNRLKNKLISAINYTPYLSSDKSYNIADINWEDSAASKNSSPVADPSMNDYIKGYNMGTSTKDEGRYEFKQYAKNKYAAKETVDISYTPENLAKRILTLWRNNGELQTFFDAFTSNQKMTNEMKKKIAKILSLDGYHVIPTLIDEKVRYAKTLNGFIKKANKYLKNNNMDNFLYEFVFVFPDSPIIKKVLKDSSEIKKNNKTKIDNDAIRGLMDYYEKIFPKDFAKNLFDYVVDNPRRYFDDFKDFELSDETLNRMEQFNKGEQRFMSNSPKDGGIGGYNFPADFRGEGPGGVPPNAYESRVAKKKK